MLMIKKCTKTGKSPLSWYEVHISTVARFKANFICRNGHEMILKSHNITTEGDVSPSVVCPVQGCDFHDWIHLLDWDHGAVS